MVTCWPTLSKSLAPVSLTTSLVANWSVVWTQLVPTFSSTFVTTGLPCPSLTAAIDRLRRHLSAMFLCYCISILHSVPVILPLTLVSLLELLGLTTAVEGILEYCRRRFQLSESSCSNPAAGTTVCCLHLCVAPMLSVASLLFGSAGICCGRSRYYLQVPLSTPTSNVGRTSFFGVVSWISLC